MLHLPLRACAAFGGSHRAYYAWRWPLLRRRVGRILVEREAAAPRGGVEFSTWTAPQHLLGDGAGGTAGCSSSASTGGAEQQEGLRRMSLDVPSGAHHPGGGGGGVTSVALAAEGMHQQPTWSPTGALLAYTQTAATGGGLVSSVVVADGATGAPLASWHLATPMPPFYYIWSACGTRLLFLRFARHGSMHLVPSGVQGWRAGGNSRRGWGWRQAAAALGSKGGR